MILYYCNISQIDGLDSIKLLSAERAKRVMRYSRQADRMRCLAAGLMLRYTLGNAYAEIRLKKTGKPYVENGPCFNLSHSGSYVILGIAENEVGVDIEQISRYDPKLPLKFFSKDEQEWISSHNDENTFFKLWTAKESVLKALGTGFTKPSNEFSVLPLTDGIHTVDCMPWYISWHELDGHMICTCCKEKKVLLIPLEYTQLIGEVL